MQVSVVGSVFEVEVEVEVEFGFGGGGEREEFVGALGGRERVTVMGEEAIARCAASLDSKMATIGRSPLAVLLKTSYFWRSVSCL